MTHSPWQPISPSRLELGEGLRIIDGTVHWVDLLRGELYAWTPGSADRATLVRTFDAPLGFVEKASDGRLIAALGTGLSWLREDGSVAEIASTGLNPSRHRVNDGSFAPDGSCWFGTMVHDGSPADGHLWRWDPETGETSCMMSGIEIPNGPVFLPEIEAMLIADTVAGKILSKSLVPGSSVEPFVTVDGGSPDGVHVDCEGRLWNAVWGGNRLDVYAPGERRAKPLDLPVSQPTSVTLTAGDEPLVIVTSASIGLETPGELDGFTIAAPLSLLALEPARVRGLRRGSSSQKDHSKRTP
ncbi:SMP-30/gluconolactonase/LRE family protein [Arthrobacter sp. N199823]|uniref:SMP-30/gluconolactonase/LRE family protein n=1 Tax=Arthrobacter sp. N199823 TaxID=2058895 RepID=UPI000CE48E87|nr:SMP-30/gluconolactonase/LRE family protein [Arthrobacter sp. N199823]